MAFSSLPVHGAGSPFSTTLAGSLADRSRRDLSRSDAAVVAPRRGGGRARGVSSATPLLLAAVLCLMALLVAPEQPQDQEAICQRHNGAAACRVW